MLSPIVLLCIVLQFGFQQPNATNFAWRSDQTIICSQKSEEREALIREAIENKYTVRRVEFVGNKYTRDNILRRRFLLEEGDYFTRDNLIESLRSVSKLKKIIYPVTLGDVMISLDQPDKMVDMIICFKEKRK